MTRLALVLLSIIALPVAGQKRSVTKPRVSFEAGAGFGSTYFVREADTRVRGTFAPMIGAGALWATGFRWRAGFLARASRDGVRVTQRDRTWDAGHVTRFDLSGTLGWESERMAVRGTAGSIFLSGPDDVVPFRGQGTAMHWGGGFIVDGAMGYAGRLRWRAGVDGVWMTPSGTATPGADGVVQRFTVGVAYAL